MADKSYSGLTIIITTAKDCGKCTAMKNQGIMDNIIRTLKAKGVNVVEKGCESRLVENPYPQVNRVNEYLNSIVGWFPQFIVLPSSYYDNAEKYSVKEMIKVSNIFNGYYDNASGAPTQKQEYSKFDDANFTKFLDKYLVSSEYKSVSFSSTSSGPSDYSSSGYTPSYSSASRSGGPLSRPNLGTGVGAGPGGAPSFSNTQRRVTPGLDAPSSIEPASKNKDCVKSDFVLFSRGL